LSDIVDFLKNLEKKDQDPHFISYESLMYAAASGEKKYESLDELTQKRNAVRQETEQILKNAEENKKRIEEEAFQKGFDAGKKQGEEAGLKEFEEKINQAVSLVSELEKERVRIREMYEHDILTLAKVMIERLVHHEMTINPLVIQASLKKALDYVVENSQVKVHLHHEDFELVKQATLKDPSFLPGNVRIQLVEDAAISRGGCLLETDFGEIDATFENGRDLLFAAVDKAVSSALQEGRQSNGSDQEHSG
jgi:flagellar assembly protein FliH